MVYCTIDKVRSINSTRTYDNTSTPTINQVNDLIAMIASDINGEILGMGYPLPASSTDFLETMNAMGAAAFAEASMFSGGSKENYQPQGWKWDTYQKMLNKMKDKPAVAGLMISGSGGGGSASNVTEGNSGASFDIRMDKESW